MVEVMSDNDPRLGSVKGWVAEDWERELREHGISFADDSLTERAVDMLADLDHADRAAGIIRVDTNDDALVERLAETLAHDLDDEPYWSCVVIAKRILVELREATR